MSTTETNQTTNANSDAIKVEEKPTTCESPVDDEPGKSNDENENPTQNDPNQNENPEAVKDEVVVKDEVASQQALVGGVDATPEEEEYLYPDMATKTEWAFNEMVRIPNRREALIQQVGNWRLIKFRKTYDTFECMQCGAALLIYKHPSFCEAKVVHKMTLKKDFSFDPSLVKKVTEKAHKPFDD